MNTIELAVARFAVSLVAAGLVLCWLATIEGWRGLEDADDDVFAAFRGHTTGNA